MSSLLALSRRLALGVAAIALVASWTASGARAEVAYAYAEQTISNLTADEGVTLQPPIPAEQLSQTSANLNGASVGFTVRGPDAPQSLIGPGPGENSFVKFAQFAGAPSPLPAGTLPTAPAASFSRGDVLLSGNSGSAVAETYLNGAGQIGGADGNNHISYNFTATAGTHTITFDVTNDLYAAVKSTSDVANGTFSFSVKLTGGGFNEFLTVPAITNSTLTVPPNAPEVINHQTGLTVTTPTLVAGTPYTITFSLDANTNAATAVPEPATMAMALTALPLVGFGLVRRHRNRKVQA